MNDFLTELKFHYLWQYIIFAALAALIPFLLAEHIVIDTAMSLVAWLSSWISDRFVGTSHALGAILGYFLFTALMPFLGHLFLPLLVFMEIFFATSYLKKYAAQYRTGYVIRRSVARDLFIVLKWTVAKFGLFVVLHPLFHVPFLGLSCSVLLSTAWWTIIYLEVVTRACSTRSLLSVARTHGADVFKAALVGVLVAYVLIGFLAYAAIVIPPARVPASMIIALFVVSGGFLGASEIFRELIGHEVKSSNTSRLEVAAL